MKKVLIPGEYGLIDRIEDRPERFANRDSIVIRKRVRDPVQKPIYKENILNDLFGDDRIPIYGLVKIY